MEDVDPLKPFNGKGSMGTVGSYRSRYNTPSTSLMLGPAAVC